ncbi:hypothetical protein KTF23_20870 [Burkholderia multivorans]|uniref:hypothetical protein n=1 Tax=Burkholderia multivorans TaxID=87883 RepID=UPI001C24A2E2|nr:hypothetical protein [Burkholderia multivorans]MBU9692280.1 hypothetical protein [Burkholderia multivorans]
MSQDRPDPYSYEIVAQEFDRKYYLACNPDVEAAGVDALDHFMVHGWRERRNPSRDFDVRYYLASNPDVDAAGINPFLHYLQSGRLEGRLPRRPLDIWRRQIESSNPIYDRQKDWLGAADVTPALSRLELAERLRERNRGVALAISVSHDDYVESFGGIQNIISDEQKLFCENGWNYLHICPAAPLPTLGDAAHVDSFRLKLRIDGDALGVTTVETLTAVFQEWLPNGSRTELLIHHLLGHSPEAVAKIARAFSVTRPKMWLHDFFTLCPSYALMRNDVAFCGAPQPGSGACRVCTYGSERAGHLERIWKFFEELVPDIAAPSSVALRFWLEHSSYPVNSHRVIAPANVYLACSSNDESVSATRALTIAHIGARSFLKGWSVFEELALRFRKDPRYRFLQLGAQDGPPLIGCIRNVPVKVSAEERSAMIEAVAEQNIDVVVSWSLWPETFCFAVHEALAGGAFVVARKDAGNVWPAVSSSAPQRGVAVDDMSALFELFEGGELMRLVNNSTRLRGAVLNGEHSYGWIASQHRTEDEKIDAEVING